MQNIPNFPSEHPQSSKLSIWVRRDPDFWILWAAASSLGQLLSFSAFIVLLVNGQMSFRPATIALWRQTLFLQSGLFVVSQFIYAWLSDALLRARLPHLRGWAGASIRGAALESVIGVGLALLLPNESFLFWLLTATLPRLLTLMWQRDVLERISPRARAWIPCGLLLMFLMTALNMFTVNLGLFARFIVPNISGVLVGAIEGAVVISILRHGRAK